MFILGKEATAIKSKEVGVGKVDKKFHQVLFDLISFSIYSQMRMITFLKPKAPSCWLTSTLLLDVSGIEPTLYLNKVIVVEE